MSTLSRRYDLHCHSNQSDGILSPEDLVSRAKDQDVSVLALTDHDTIAGLERAKKQAEIVNIDIITGVEFSCKWAGRNIHVVALGFDETHPKLLAQIESQTKMRDIRASEIAARLEKIGFKDAMARAQAQSGGAVIGRPHFAKAMVAMGFCSSVDQAFKKYLGAGKPGDIKQIWPEFGDLLPDVVEAGGIPVLAHPLKYKLTRSKLSQLLEDFIEYGGRAMEVVSGQQRQQDTHDMARLVNRFDLLASCGSDFHAPSKPWSELGRYSEMPDTVKPVWQAWE